MRFFRQRWFIMIFAVSSIATLSHVEPASACTVLPGPKLEEQLKSASIIVRGQIVESDEVYQNYILQVDEYLAGGSGPEYLLITLNSPRNVQGVMDDILGGGDCHRLWLPLPELQTGYFWLYPTIFGTYWGDPLAGFMFSEDVFPITFYTEDSNLEYSLERAEFEEWIKELRNSEFLQPLPNSRYPATAPLLISDEVGNEYLLPVASTELISLTEDSSWLYIPEAYRGERCIVCDSWECLTLSPDNRTFLLESEGEYAYILDHHLFEFAADHLVLSPIGIAVWIDNKIQIYALHQTLRAFSDRAQRQITEVELNVGDDKSSGVWSQDGQLFAFSDGDGVWLWNPFQPDSHPQLILSHEDQMLHPLQFAGYGHYLAVGSGETRFVIDLITRTKMPFGYISPDGQLMISCNEEIDDVCTLTLQQLAPVAISPRDLGIVDRTQGLRVEWVNARRALIYGCDPIENNCGIYDFNPYAVNWESMTNYYNVSVFSRVDFVPALDFAVQGRNVAVLNNPTTITVNGDILEFETVGPIVEIRWLPEFFYGGEVRIPLRPPIKIEK